MKKELIVLLFGAVFSLSAQNITLKKGIVIDSVMINDSITESAALYLPRKFDPVKNWPLLIIYDMQGKGQKALHMFKDAAEKEGFVLLSPNNVNDTLPIAENLRISSRLLSGLGTKLSIDKDRIYTGGFDSGARLAAMVPTFMKSVQGVLLCGATVPNTEVLTSSSTFHVITVVGNRDYNYPTALGVEKTLNKLKFPNELLVFDGGQEWPPKAYLAKAMEIFTLASMAKNHIARREAFINRTYKENIAKVNRLSQENEPLLAFELLSETISVYQAHIVVDSLRERAKALKKSKGYKSRKRNENNAFFKESLLKQDYAYYLEEDVISYNYNNLGWWTYQMEEIAKYEKSGTLATRQMGSRIRGYINALVEDTIDVVLLDGKPDLEALNFLWMLKTITEPKAYDYYLKVISNSALIDDYGTALFYLEELLKNGYKDTSRLYELDHTAVLRISPEFNELIQKYLKDARYEIIEE